MAIIIYSGEVIEGDAPFLNIELNGTSKSSLYEVDNRIKVEGSDVIVNKEGNPVGNSKSNSNVKVGVNSVKLKMYPRPPKKIFPRPQS